MLNKTVTSLEHIIAKIDNDFNPDQSDWIPRVGTWAIEVMSTLNVLKKHTVKRKLVVQDRIAYSDCAIDSDNLKVYDSKGCEIYEAKDSGCGCNDFSTGNRNDNPTTMVNQTTYTNSQVVNHNPKPVPDETVFQEINQHALPPRYNVYNYNYGDDDSVRNYVLIGCDKLELNFDAKCIYIESNEIVTKYSQLYECEIPIIPNNGFLIECIAQYCMYKMLTRGYKHPVMNLRDNSPATNPYIAWMTLQPQARTNLILDAQGEVIEDKGLWRSAFYINTFNPK